MKKFNQNKNKKAAGFTLVELMVTLGIAGILMAYAMPAYRDFGLRQSITNQVNNLITDITYTRVTAVKYGQQVVIQAKPDTSGTADWEEGWQIYIDDDKDESYDASNGDILLRDESVSSKNLAYTASDTYISFNNLGSSPSAPITIAISHADISEDTTINVAASGLISH
jgi:type IV fimbrial biogenesis protein FimT